MTSPILILLFAGSPGSARQTKALAAAVDLNARWRATAETSPRLTFATAATPAHSATTTTFA
ncbi:MAG TPA: hypothetical protein VFW87_09515 [Pirellulales bacterium]|nr:hypothetical protein [Pirellulales bacterium]